MKYSVMVFALFIVLAGCTVENTQTSNQGASQEDRVSDLKSHLDSINFERKDDISQVEWNLFTESEYDFSVLVPSDAEVSQQVIELDTKTRKEFSFSSGPIRSILVANLDDEQSYEETLDHSSMRTGMRAYGPIPYEEFKINGHKAFVVKTARGEGVIYTDQYIFWLDFKSEYQLVEEDAISHLIGEHMATPEGIKKLFFVNQ